MEKRLKLYRDANIGDQDQIQYTSVKNIFDVVLQVRDAVALYGYKSGDCYICIDKNRSTNDYDYKVVEITNAETADATISTIDNGTNFLIQSSNSVVVFNNNEFSNSYVPFPSESNQIDINEFTYSSERMGEAPTITATFYSFECYDNKWNVDVNGKCVQRFDNIFTFFNGERYYLNLTPTSSFSNEDARYKHDLTFISERMILKHVLMFDTVPQIYDTFSIARNYVINDIVQYGGMIYQFKHNHTAGEWDISQVKKINRNINPITETSQFSFFGNIEELSKRINASLVSSNVTKLVTADNGDYTKYYGYHIIVDPYDEFYPTKSYSIDDIVIYENKYYRFITNHSAGEWNTDDVREYTLEEKLISIDNNTILDALKLIESEFDYMYYIDSNKEIHIRNYQTDISDEIEYGVNNELLSISRNNATTDIITRMTALGSSDNIPYYYPNPTEDGWLKPRYNGEETTRLVCHSDTEAFLKNRLSTEFEFGSGTRVFRTSFKETPISQPTYMTDGFVTVGNKRRRYIKIRFRAESDDKFSILLTDSLFNWIGVSDINPLIQRNKYGGVLFQKYNTNDTTNYDEFYTQNKVYVSYRNTDTGKYTADFFVTQYIETYFFGNNWSTSYIGFRQEQITRRLKPWRPGGNIFGAEKDFTWYDRFYPFEPKLAFYARRKYGSQTDYITVTDDFYGAGHFLGDSVVGGVILVDLNCVVATGDANYIDPQRYSGYQTPMEMHTGYFYVDLSSIDENGCCNVYLCGSSNPYYDSLQGASYTLDLMNASYIETGEHKSNNYVQKFTFSYKTQNYMTALRNVTVQKMLHDWYLNREKVDLRTYGLECSGTPELLDKITFVQELYLTPQPNLMPELYFKTNGERRFYHAIQYPFSPNEGYDIDVDSGEYFDYELNMVSNNHYKTEGGAFSIFQNPYKNGKPREHSETFDDIKPSIKDQKYLDRFIDIVEEFAYDDSDNDELINDNSDDNNSLSYKHPYFFAKLRPLGFNIFDMAIDEDSMVINMTTGHCGACSFNLMVGKTYKQNTVRIWEYDVYKYDELESEYTKKYSKGDLVRYDNDTLYNLVDGVYQQIPNSSISNPPENRSWGDVICTDIILSQIEESQKDTTDNYVWVCLQKDVNTFGMIMPSRTHTLLPKPVVDVENDIRDETSADKFVITHIKMPQFYIRAAESKLSDELIKYMATNNSEIFSYQIKFSRIFFATNDTFANNLNENSLLHIKYADHQSQKAYVSSFTYKISANESLPEITVNLKDPTAKARYRKTDITPRRDRDNNEISSIINNYKSIKKTVSKCIQRENDEILTGNIKITGTITGNLATELPNGDKVFLSQIQEQANSIGEESRIINNSLSQKANRNETPSLSDFEIVQRTLGDKSTGVVKDVQTLVDSVGDSSKGLIKSVSQSISSISIMSENISEMSESISTSLQSIATDERIIQTIGGLSDETISKIEDAANKISHASTAISSAIDILNNEVSEITSNDIDKFIIDAGIRGVSKNDIVTKYSLNYFNKILSQTFGTESTIYLTSIKTEPLISKQGDIYFNEYTKKFYEYNGNSWDEISIESMEYHTYICESKPYIYSDDTMKNVLYYRTDGSDETSNFIRYDLFNDNIISIIKKGRYNGLLEKDIYELLSLEDRYNNVIIESLNIANKYFNITKIQDWINDYIDERGEVYRYISLDSWGENLIETVRVSITGYDMIHTSDEIIKNISNDELWSMYIVEHLIGLGKAMKHFENNSYTYHGTFNDVVIEFIQENQYCTEDEIISNFGGNEYGKEYMYTVEYLVSVNIVRTDGEHYWIEL